ncbi:kinase-like domain-containing protein [Lactarius akahatsu]|uniref:Serine/threonine-protein kinase n=1 Tax=Lactarius akahatsu TaxID=416441 RepID=A0AAD4LL83_9AGAM|nr:kinase-like domain-containing protein [Lactarius akahatsu]
MSFLGEGGFAKVYQVRDCRNNYLACKVVTKSSLKTKKAKTKLYAEIKIHKALDHLNIVRFIDCFEDDENVYMTLELCPSGSLVSMLHRRRVFTEPEARFFMMQLIGACHYMHTHQVIHRDLKLGNVLLDADMNIKVGDFGLAALIESPGERKKIICVDIWSIGVIVYTFVVDRPPFQTKGVKEVRIRDDHYVFPSHRDVSLDARELVQQILYSSPTHKSGPRCTTSSTTRSLPAASFLDSTSGLQGITEEGGAAYEMQGEEVRMKELQSQKVRIVAQMVPARIPRSTESPFEDAENGPAPVPETAQGDRRARVRTKDPQAVLGSSGGAVATTPTPAAPKERVLIASWVDYRDKYGMGYAVTDGSVGVRFNDSTTLVVAADKQHFDHISSRRHGTVYVRKNYTVADYPEELKNKVYLLKRFEGHIMDLQRTECMHLVQKYLRVKHVTVFKLSHDVLQFNFYDHSKIILSAQGLAIAYIDKNYVLTRWTLSQVMAQALVSPSPDPEQAKFTQRLLDKLRYCKEVLLSIRSASASASSRVSSENGARISAKPSKAPPR